MYSIALLLQNFGFERMYLEVLHFFRKRILAIWECLTTNYCLRASTVTFFLHFEFLDLSNFESLAIAACFFSIWIHKQKPIINLFDVKEWVSFNPPHQELFPAGCLPLAVEEDVVWMILGWGGWFLPDFVELAWFLGSWNFSTFGSSDGETWGFRGLWESIANSS